MKAFLILADGTVYQGIHIGAEREIISEIVFNTAMTGYLEELTDPAYAGQAICMTYPLIGNYGICQEDSESRQAWADGLIVRELSRTASNFRNDLTIQDYLKAQGITGIAGIDTRALTKLLRIKGTMSGCITTDEKYLSDDNRLADLLSCLKAYRCQGMVTKVTSQNPYEIKGVDHLHENGPLPGSVRFKEADYQAGHREKTPSLLRALSGKGKKVAVLDCGVKRSQIDSLTMRGCDVTVYPADTTAETLLAGRPDGILLSGGPGNPMDNMGIVAEIKKLYVAEIPLFAIGLGHQLLALALGGTIQKMKHGHRGGNHPVKDLTSGKVIISAQNHGYMVNPDSIDKKVAVPAFCHVNDGTCEGLAYLGKRILSIQFSPETTLDPVHADSLFERFVGLMETKPRTIDQA